LVFLVHTSLIIPVISGAKRYLEIIPGQHSTDYLEKKKTIIIGTSRIISRAFVQSETQSLSGELQQWLKKLITKEKYLN
jgi:hypothetical protein